MTRIIIDITPSSNDDRLPLAGHDRQRQIRLHELQTEYVHEKADLQSIVHQAQAAFRRGK